jgi:hypothetical protein
MNFLAAAVRYRRTTYRSVSLHFATGRVNKKPCQGLKPKSAVKKWAGSILIVARTSVRADQSPRHYSHAAHLRFHLMGAGEEVMF